MFRTLRSKLIFSYVGIALLCLLLSVLGTLALARDYAQREGYTTLQEKWSLTMPLLRATLVAQRRPNNPASALVLGGIQTAIRNADVRLLLLDPGDPPRSGGYIRPLQCRRSTSRLRSRRCTAPERPRF